MASIKIYQAINGIQNYFEAASAHLLPYKPVPKKRVDHAGGKRGPSDISDTTGEEAYGKISSFGTNKGNGSSGFPLRYHTKAEYDLLKKEQNNELCEWRKGKSEGGKRKGSDHKFDTTKDISSAVKNKVTERLKAIEQEKSNGDEAYAWIMSIMKKHDGKSGNFQILDTTAEPTPTLTAPTIRSIIKQANNAKACT